MKARLPRPLAACALASLVAAGCTTTTTVIRPPGGGPSGEELFSPGTPPQPPPSTQTTSGDPASRTGESCFGIPVSFAGPLTDEMKAAVPEAFRGAYRVEAVREISAARLAEKTGPESGTPLVAEEVRDGRRYAAVRDLRRMRLQDGVQAVIVVIERYWVTE